MVEYRIAERAADYVVLALRGDLAGGEPLARLHDMLEEHYVDNGVKLIRVDLREVPRITLEGIATLLALWKESLSRGKRFRVDNPQDQVATRMRETGVLGVLTGQG